MAANLFVFEFIRLLVSLIKRLKVILNFLIEKTFESSPVSHLINIQHSMLTAY